MVALSPRGGLEAVLPRSPPPASPRRLKRDARHAGSQNFLGHPSCEVLSRARAAEAFNALASLRRGKRVDRLGAERALQLAAETVAALLGLKAPKLSELAKLEGRAVAAWAREEGGELVFTILCLEGEGARVYELAASGISEVQA